jgi:hypothetical protein
MRKRGRGNNREAVCALVVLGVLLLFSIGGISQTLLDHTMCRSVPPFQRVSEFRTTDAAAYSWIVLGDVTGIHQLEWEWYAPNGRLYRADGPTRIDATGVTYPFLPVARPLSLQEAGVRAQAGQWRVDIVLDNSLLISEEFSIVIATSVGDYGDAPDGQPCGYAEDPTLDVLARFPTRYDTTNSRLAGEPGAHAILGGQEALGDVQLTSLEKGADDASDPDGTPNLVDDDLDDGLTVTLLPFGNIEFVVQVSASSDAPAGTRYLNALYDVNRDGEWRDTISETEWIVKNRAVNLLPGETKEISIPVPIRTEWISALTEPRWLRLAVTDSLVSETKYAAVGGWDGSGQFTRGEIEDYKIGVASAHDIAWSARQSARLAWASASAQAQALAWSFSLAQAEVTAIAAAHAEALTYVYAAEAAYDSACASATASAGAYQRALVEAAAFSSATVVTPCATLTAWASASVAASVEAAATATAQASAAATAASEAHAVAIAWADAVAVAMANARATAASFAIAVAEASARADALAASWASAQAWAGAWAQAAGEDATTAALALAWVQARTWAFASATASASARAWAATFTHAEAIASAFAGVEVSVLAAAQASATATAWASAAADATAIASTAVQAIQNAAAGASATVIEDCCEQLVDCPRCDSCCPYCPACNSCCAPCAACNSCCDAQCSPEVIVYQPDTSGIGPECEVTVFYYLGERARVRVHWLSSGGWESEMFGYQNAGQHQLSVAPEPGEFLGGLEVVIVEAATNDCCPGYDFAWWIRPMISIEFPFGDSSEDTDSGWFWEFEF